MKVLVLGASGMIGGTMVRILAHKTNWEVIGSLRTVDKRDILARLGPKWIFGINLAEPDHLIRLFREIHPDVVVNCAGLTKHLPSGNDPVPALTMNALLPHRLAELCGISHARLIHISTDCVFSGKKGNYSEDDPADATDIYGKTKHLGEVMGTEHVTLRTSTIGHETGTRFGLLEWFLAQRRCKGYSKAIFSGLPTIEFAKVVRDMVIPNTSLVGLYNVGARPIDKNSLLHQIAKIYSKQIDIELDDQVNIDRSLNSNKFSTATGYCAPDWSEMIEAMHQDKMLKGLRKDV